MVKVEWVEALKMLDDGEIKALIRLANNFLKAREARRKVRRASEIRRRLR